MNRNKAALMVHVVGEMTAAVCSHEGDVDRGVEILRHILPCEFDSAAMNGLAGACMDLIAAAPARKSPDFAVRNTWITARLTAAHWLARVHRVRIGDLLEAENA